MKLVRLHIDGFGKFHQLDISCEQGLNILYGKNEAGKSTLHAFIKAMLYGFHKIPGHGPEHDLRTKYEPWKSPEEYGGTLLLEQEGRQYEIQRNFQENAETLSILDVEKGIALEDPEAFLKTMLGTVTETTFDNTVSIGQLRSATGQGMVAELQKYIRNLSTTGDLSLSAEDAINDLDAEKNALSHQLVPQAAKSYASLVGEIRNMEKEIAKPEYANEYRKIQSLREETRDREIDRQTKKELLLQRIASEQTTMEQSGFHEPPEIEEAVQRTDTAYQTYQTLSGKAGANALIAPILLLALTLFGAVLSVLIYLSIRGQLPPMAAALAAMNFNPPVLLVVCAGISVLLLVISLFLFVRRSRRKKSLDAAAAMIRGILTKQLGAGDITAEAMAAFHNHMKALIDTSDALNADEAELAALTQELQTLSEDERKYDFELQKENEKQSELDGKLQHLSSIRNQADILAGTVQRNKEISEKLDALSLAIETLEELTGTIGQSFGHYLNEEAGKLISGITGGIYDSMWIDQKLNIYMNTPDKMVPLEDVSSGTMDQIYLAVRLAAASLLQSSVTDRLPLIFDDSFAMYDEDRLRSALHFITEIHTGQILLFTCHTREKRILEEENIPYNMTEL